MVWIEDEMVDHESCAEQPIMLSPGRKPCREVSIRHHTYVVHSPSIHECRFSNDFNKGKPVPVGLPELGFGQGELVRKQRDIQGMLPSSVAENNLLILESSLN